MNENYNDNPQQLQTDIRDFHYTAVHTALEQWLDEDIPGSITRVEYPAKEADKGMIRVFFTKTANVK